MAAMLVCQVKGKLRNILMKLDKDGDQRISKTEFEKILDSQEAGLALQNVDVDVVCLVDFADYIFDGPGGDGFGSEGSVFRSSLSSTNDGFGSERSMDERGSLSFTGFMELVLQLRGSNTAKQVA